MKRNASGVAHALADARGVADDREHGGLEPGVVDGPAEVRERVHLPDGRVDEVGLVPLPARLVLLRAAVVVDGEQHPTELAGRGPDVHGRLPAVGAHLEERPIHRTAAAASYSANPSSAGMKPRAASAWRRSSGSITRSRGG